MPYIPLLRSVEDQDEIVLPKKVPEMVRVPPTGFTGIVLSKTLFRLPTHWNGSRTTICTAPKDCELCNTSELREYYLVGFSDNNDRTPVWVQLTPPAGRSLLDQCKALNRPLYATVIKITRARKKGNSPISVAVDQWGHVAAKLPVMVDPQETMARVFGSLDLARQLHDERVE